MAKQENSRNPFLDDDIDDFEFLNHPQQGQSGYLLSNETFSTEQNEWEDKRMQLLEERRRIEERTLQSTNSSLGLLHESEQIGILTAEELVKQREQLEKVEENLDIINNTMRTSQKHINSLKSIFGGIKNYFSKSSVDSPVKAYTEPHGRRASNSLQETVDNMKADSKYSELTHPGLKIRELPYDEQDSSFDFEVAKDRAQPIKPPISFTADIEEKLDKNLENMSLGLGRLKNLALGLNEEVEQQNEKIDLIHNKVDKADETLEHQNRQIKRILKK